MESSELNIRDFSLRHIQEYMYGVYKSYTVDLPSA